LTQGLSPLGLNRNLLLSTSFSFQAYIIVRLGMLLSSMLVSIGDRVSMNVVLDESLVGSAASYAVIATD
jgi:hypothetical protein